MTDTNVITHTVKERGREREGGREGGREEERGRRREEQFKEEGEGGRHTAEGLVSLQRGSVATTDDEGPSASPRTSLGAMYCL